jgi:hypothetical protein
MSKETDTDARVELARVLTRGHLRIRLSRNGVIVIAENALAILAAVLVFALLLALI